MKNIILAGAAVALLFSGCATIIDGKTQKINLQSKKPTKVTIDGKTYNSPGIITVNRKGEDAVVKVKDCKQDKLLKKEINPTFYVNILSGGPIGSTTDYSTDSMWQYDTTNLNVDCK